VIYSIEYYDSSAYGGGLMFGGGGGGSYLRQMSEETGGHVYKVDRKHTLEQVFKELQDEMRSQYAIAYTPLNETKDGSYRKIDIKLSAPLFKLPGGVDANRRALPALNLRRGRALGLPSGQDVAGAMSITPLTATELGLNGLNLPASQLAALKAHTPLWYYVLREAQVKGSGEHLGPVGGRIVAEVLVGLLDGDPQSYFSQKPMWKPFLPAKTAGDFKMADLVKFTLG